MSNLINYIKSKYMNKYKKCYIINSNEIGEYQICKVLNIYESQHKAIKELSKLLSREVSEFDLLEDFNTREML